MGGGQVTLSDERAAQIENVIARVTEWVAGRRDVVGLLLVGSVARGAAREDSDVDLIVLSTDPGRYAELGWAAELGFGKPIRAQEWGAIIERRCRTGSGLEVEFGFGEPSWAGIDPVDPGTRRVVTDGCRPLHDPHGLLTRLLAACRPMP